MSWQQRNKALKAEMLAGIEAGQTFGMSEQDKQDLRDQYANITTGARDRLRRSHQKLLKTIKNTPWNQVNVLARHRTALNKYERMQLAGVFSPQGRGRNPSTGGVIPYQKPPLIGRILEGAIGGAIGGILPNTLEGTTGLIGTVGGGGFPIFGAIGGIRRNWELKFTDEGIPYSPGGMKPLPKGGFFPGGGGETTGTTIKRTGEALLPLIPFILPKGGGGTGGGGGKPIGPGLPPPFVPPPILPPIIGSNNNGNNNGSSETQVAAYVGNENYGYPNSEENSSNQLNEEEMYGVDMSIADNSGAYDLHVSEELEDYYG